VAILVGDDYLQFRLRSSYSGKLRIEQRFYLIAAAQVCYISSRRDFYYVCRGKIKDLPVLLYILQIEIASHGYPDSLTRAVQSLGNERTEIVGCIKIFWTYPCPARGSEIG